MPTRADPVRSKAVVAALLSMSFVAAANGSVLAPLLPGLATRYSLSVAESTWIFTMLFLTAGVFTILLPRLADVISDKWAAIAVPLLLTLGSATMAFAVGYPMLLIGAALLGAAGSGSGVAIAALRRAMGETRIGPAVGAAMASVMIGAGVGGVLAGWGASALSIPVFFGVLGLVTLVDAVLIGVIVPHRRGAERGHLGVLSIVLLAVWLMAVLFGVSRGPEWGWGDVKTWGVIGGGVVLAIVWAMRERRLQTPLVDFALFRRPAFTRTMIAGLALGLPASGLVLLVPMVTQMDPAIAPWGLGLAPVVTALILLPQPIIGALGTILGGRMTSRGLALTAVAIGGSAQVVGALWLTFFHDSVASFVGAVLFYGAGIGLVQAGLFGSVQRTVEPDRAGMAAGTLGLAILFSGAVGPVVYSAVLSSQSLDSAPGVASETAITLAFAVLAVFEVVVLAAAASGIPTELRARRETRAVSVAVA